MPEKQILEISGMQKGRRAGVTGTPGNIINGELRKGAIPFSQLDALIQGYLR